jgi:hypothetical protein
MRLLQILGGAVITIGLMWFVTIVFFGRPIYAQLPVILDDIPWSEKSTQPAHVPTALLQKPCDDQLRTNDDLRTCLEKAGLKTGFEGDGGNWATFESGFGFSPKTHRLTWTSEKGELPRQVDAVRE